MTEVVSIQAGTTVGISASLPATFDSAGYAALTFSVLGEVVDYSAGGKQYSTTERVPLAGDTTKYLKAIKSYAQETFTMSRDDDDAGQIIALAGVDAKTDYSIEINNPDGTVDYYTGIVLSYNDTRGDASAIINKAMVVQPTSDTVTVAPV